MSNEVRDLFAVIGKKLVCGEVPAFKRSFDALTKQTIFSVPGESRKLIVDPDGAINWYNADGPENI